MKYWLLALFTCSLSYVYSADIPKGNQIEILSDFSGGLNTTAPQHKIPRNCSPNMRNVSVHRVPGQIIKRNGYIVVGSSFVLQRISYGFTFNHADRSKEFIVTDSSVVLSTRDYLTYVFISSGLNVNSNLECTQNGYKVYCTNGIDAVFSWDGTTKVKLDGTNGTPNIPRGSYITSFLNRIWVGHTASDPSSLDWSAVASTAGAILTPDHFLAWPPANHHSVGIGDGESLNAIWVYRGQLQIGKQDSIYTEFGDRDSNFLERKTVSQAGISSNDSVVVLDGLTYYKSKNGVYAYDGSEAKRISDNIVPDIAAMKDADSSVLENVWDSQSQFLKGQFIGSTVTADGFVTINDQRYQVNYDTYQSGFQLPKSSSYTFPVGTTTTDFAPFTSTNPIPNNFLGYISVDIGFAPISVQIWAKGVGCSGSGGSWQVSATIKNTRTGVLSGFGNGAATPSCDNFSLMQIYAKSVQEPVFSAEDIRTGSMTIAMTVVSNNGFPLTIYPATGTGFSDIYLTPATTVQYVSDVTTLTSVSAWGNFNAIDNSKGGNLKYYFRSSTSVINITTQTWSSASPGAVLNAPLQNNFIQWASTITSVSTITLTGTNIDQVTIDHIEGNGSFQRVLATDWNNEYWLSVSTDLSSNLRLQYVKSWITNPTPNAWNVMSGMNIGSIWKDSNNTLYGGSSSTGTIYRLDYGTNDNGQAIDAFYETPQIVMKGALFGGPEGNWMKEHLSEFWVDADAENGNTFRLGTSLDGKAFTDNTFSLSGTGRILKIIYTPNGYARYFKWRFRNNDLDKGLGLNSFAVLYTPTDIR